MSEYQYYEFRAIDRPLTDAQMRTLRAVSTRGDISPTRFVNEYHWGDLKADPNVWMKKYFDAHLYYANWGTHVLMLKIPSALLGPAEAKSFARNDSFTARRHQDSVILDFRSDDEGGDWEDIDSAFMTRLIAVRSEIMNGDRRALYLGWLSSSFEAGDVASPEPALPGGLGKLTSAQRLLADFLRIESDLLRAAQTLNPPKSLATTPSKDAKSWVKGLPAAEKNEFLSRILGEKSGVAVSELRMRFLSAQRPKEQTRAHPSGRTFLDVLKVARMEDRFED